MENDQAAMQQSYQYEVVQLRLQCLHLAAKTERPDVNPDVLIADAQKFYDFLSPAPKPAAA